MADRPKKSDPGFQEVMAAMPEPPLPRRSAVHIWLRRNSKQVERQIAEHKMDWAAFAVALAKAGVTKKDGQAFSGAAVKQTWYRVRPVRGKSAKAAPARQETAVSKPEPAQPADTFPAMPTTAPVASDEPSFTTASLKKRKGRST